MVKIVFDVLHPEEIASRVHFLVNELKEDYSKLVFLEIPKDLLKDVLSKDFEEVKDELVTLINQKYDVNKLNEKKDMLENYWNQLNNLFLENLKKITGFELADRTYNVYISNIIRGMYFSEKEVFVNPFNDIKFSGFLVAEEIFHIHYWDIFRKKIKDVKFPWRINQEIWMISEVVPEYIFNSKLFEKFGWGELNRGYPFIKNIKPELDEFWETKKDFTDFMIKVHEQFDIS